MVLMIREWLLIVMIHVAPDQERPDPAVDFVGVDRGQDPPPEEPLPKGSPPAQGRYVDITKKSPPRYESRRARMSLDLLHIKTGLFAGDHQSGRNQTPGLIHDSGTGKPGSW